MIKAKFGDDVRVGSWLDDGKGTYQVLWIDSRGYGLRAVRLVFDPSVSDNVQFSDDIRLFDDDQVAQMRVMQY